MPWGVPNSSPQTSQRGQACCNTLGCPPRPQLWTLWCLLWGCARLPPSLRPPPLLSSPPSCPALSPLTHADPLPFWGRGEGLGARSHLRAPTRPPAPPQGFAVGPTINRRLFAARHVPARGSSCKRCTRTACQGLAMRPGMSGQGLGSRPGALLLALGGCRPPPPQFPSGGDRGGYVVGGPVGGRGALGGFPEGGGLSPKIRSLKALGCHRDGPHACAESVGAQPPRLGQGLGAAARPRPRCPVGSRVGQLTGGSAAESSLALRTESRTMGNSLLRAQNQAQSVGGKKKYKPCEGLLST